MEFRVDRDALADAVAWAARTLPARPPAPLLSGMRLEANSQGLLLSTFDYEVSGRAEVPAEVPEEGVALISGRLLAEIARSLPAQPVRVSVEGTRLTLRCGRATFTLPTLPVDDYPSLPAMPASAGTLPAALFATAVAQVAVAAGRDDNLPAFTGVRLEIEGTRLTLAATDRYRLAVRELTWDPDSVGIEATALVPSRSLSEAARSLAGAGTVRVALSPAGSGDGLMGFEGAGRHTTTRLLDGEFPKYRQLMPTQSAAVASVPTAELIEAVKRVRLVAERNTPVRLHFTGAELLLQAGSGDEAQAVEELGCSLDGEPMVIAFNPDFLLDGLGALGAPTARLSMTNPVRPAVLSGAPPAAAEPDGDGPAPDPQDGGPQDGGPDGEGSGDGVPDPEYRYLIMPVRLAG